MIRGVVLAHTRFWLFLAYRSQQRPAFDAYHEWVALRGRPKPLALVFIELCQADRPDHVISIWQHYFLHCFPLTDFRAFLIVSTFGLCCSRSLIFARASKLDITRFLAKSPRFVSCFTPSFNIHSGSVVQLCALITAFLSRLLGILQTCTTLFSSILHDALIYYLI